MSFDGLFTNKTTTPVTKKKSRFSGIFQSRQTSPTIQKTPQTSGVTKEWNGQQIPANIPTKNLVHYDQATGNRTFKMPDFLGGGAYTQDKNGKLVNGGHTTYGGVETKPGYQRDDIIPASQGGANFRKENIKLIPQSIAEKQDEFEKNSSDVMSKENILKVIRQKDEITNPPPKTGFKGFLAAIPGALKEAGSLIAGKQSLPYQVGKGLVEQYTKPSEMVKKAESQGMQAPGFKQVSQAVLRTLIPLAEGFGAVIGEDILGQRELANQTVKEPPRITGKQVTPNTPIESERLITHKLTATEVVNVAMRSVEVGLLIAPLFKGIATKSTLRLAEAFAKESKVSISYSDLQKITSAASTEEAIARVGAEKYNAYKEAASSNSVKKALADGYIDLAKKEPTTFSTILKNAATNPLSDITNLAKNKGVEIKTSGFKELPEKITEAESHELPPEMLDKYISAVEDGKPILIVKQLPNPVFDAPKMIEAPKPSNRGEGFTFTDKPDKAKVAESKALQESTTNYTKAVQDFNLKPTPAKLKKVMTAKATYEDVRNPVNAPFAHEVSQNQPFAHEKPVVATKTTPQQAVKPKPVETKAIKVAEKPQPKPVPVTEGNKISGVAKSINAKAIEQGFTSKGFDKLAEFEGTTFKEQAEKVANLEVEHLKAIVRGDKPIPQGIRSAAIISAAEDLVKKTRDADLMEALANSNLATKISEGASETSLARMREKDSATMKLQEIRKAREAKADKKVSHETRKVTRTAKAETEKINLDKNELEWDKFLEEIKC